MKTFLFLVLGFIILVAVIITVGKTINRRTYKIRSSKGIQKAEYITIGGIEQYIQIRGHDIANPVMLVLHGGPGGNMAFYSYGWQTELEQAYTMVHWDQRGCGNTYYRNKKAEKPTLERLLSDLDELVDHIRVQYGQEKVVIMGHSWGTFLGGVYAGKCPEKVSAYIGIGQTANFKEAEQVSAQEAISVAGMVGKVRDAQKISKMLETVMAYQTLEKGNAAEFIKFRQLKEKYLPSQGGNRVYISCLFSPYMTFCELKWLLSFGTLIESNSKLYAALLADESADMYARALQYIVPVIIIAGDRDWITPCQTAFQYFNEISAPVKEFITISNAGHSPFIDQTGEFSEELLKAMERVREALD